MPKSQDGSVSTFVKWGEADRVEVRPANAFLVQRSSVNEVVLNIGYVPTPALSGPPAAQEAEARKLAKAGLEPTSIARFTLTLEAAQQLLGVMQQHLGRS